MCRLTAYPPSTQAHTHRYLQYKQDFMQSTLMLCRHSQSLAPQACAQRVSHAVVAPAMKNQQML
jgi:hypothetical protein